MDENTYNGWPNWPTWLVNLWLGNDYENQLRVSTLASEAIEQHPGNPAHAAHTLAFSLKNEWGFYPGDIPGMYADLLSDALTNVDWTCLARTYINDALEV